VSHRLCDLQTCGDIITHRATLNLLRYGVKDLLRAATGTTSNVREAGKREDRKSIGVERTFGDKWKREDLVEMLDKISTNLAEDMEQLGFAARCLSLKFKTHDYHRSSPSEAADIGGANPLV
jgi:DNA polymerase kappa